MMLNGDFWIKRFAFVAHVTALIEKDFDPDSFLTLVENSIIKLQGVESVSYK